jgi:hypothetical protein
VVVDGHLLHGAHGGVGEMFAFDVVRGVDSAFGLGPVIERHARALLADGDADPAGALAALEPSEITPQRILELAAVGDARNTALPALAERRLRGHDLAAAP